MTTEYEFVINPYGSKTSKGRKGVMLKGPWLPHLADIFRAAGVQAIYLNSAKGWQDFDVRFLAELPGLEEVGVIAPSVTGLEVLSQLPSLQQLEITASTKSQVAFDEMPNLQRCYLYWWPGAASIFRASGLRSIHLDKVKALPPQWYRHWPVLEELTLGNSPVPSLEGIGELRTLRRVELANLTAVASFDEIARLDNLNWLSIAGCKKLGSIEFVSSLQQLEVLLLVDDGEIASLSPIRDLTSLKAVSFVGSTTIGDGDLSPLTQLPKLSMAGFAPRKHYTHKLIKPWNWNNFGTPDRVVEAKA